MQCNGNFKQWFNIFLIISEAWQGYESKAYGVSNYNLKLQSKKLSRTRDIPNFPTQGWADTAFDTRNGSETYWSVDIDNWSAGFKITDSNEIKLDEENWMDTIFFFVFFLRIRWHYKISPLKGTLWFLMSPSLTFLLLLQFETHIKFSRLHKGYQMKNLLS